MNTSSAACTDTGAAELPRQCYRADGRPKTIFRDIDHAIEFLTYYNLQNSLKHYIHYICSRGHVHIGHRLRDRKANS